MKTIVKKHMIFGEIRFCESYPYLHDIATALNYKGLSYRNLIPEHIFRLDNDDNSLVVDDLGIEILINNSNMQLADLFKQWLFDFILPNLRKNNNIESKKDNNIISNIKSKRLNISFNKHINNIDKGKWITLPIHGFSNNYMYEYTSNGKIVKSKAYKKWRKNFPYSQLSELSHIDFDKPIQAYYIFDQVERFDTSNMIKSLSDAITDHFGVDDHQIVNQICLRGNIVPNFNKGQIHIYMYNI